jgi:Uma2 family endonuclease
MVAIARESDTVGDLIERLGGIPANRILLKPAPGAATESDLVALLDGPNKRICELIDGVLVEKAMGFRESLLASWLSRMLWNYADDNDLGIVLGADSPYRLRLGLVRLPDVSFISWGRLPGDEAPDEAVSKIIPELAIEVLSKSNTPAEIELKLDHYFEAAVRLAWVIDPKRQKARVYSSRTRIQEIGIDGELSGGKILPGFRLALRDLFAAPRRKKRKPGQA